MKPEDIYSSSSSNNLRTGNTGEDMAIKYLESKGYEILSRNWRYEKAELDIVCRKGGITVFTEVKTRRTLYFGHPEEGVTPAKQRHLSRAANGYVMAFDVHGDLRFDIISVTLLKGKEPEIYHIEDAFFPMG